MPDIPTKLFDVRNGNGVVDAGTTYPRATVIVFKDNASKDKVIDAFCTAYGYQATVPDPANPGGATIPNPQSKQAFYNAKLTDYIKDIVRAEAIKVATAAAAKTASDDTDKDLPTAVIKP